MSAVVEIVIDGRLLSSYSFACVEAKDIGVITPYYGQARRLRQELKREKLEDVKVGTVEEFQGQVCALFVRMTGIY